MGFSIRRTRELGSIGVSVPTASVMPYAGSTSPSGWLLCFGQAISRTQYADLFAAIGTAYGTGDGSTTFNLPDLRGRVVAGLDNMGGTAQNRITSAISGINGTTLGSSGGTQEVPNHTHQHVSPLGKAGGNLGVIDIYSSQLDAVGSYDYNSIQTTTVQFVGGGGSSAYERFYVTSSSQSTKGTSQNMQPTMVLNYIIKV